MCPAFFLIFPSSFVTWLQIFVTKHPAETSRSLRKPSPRPFMTLARWSSSCWAHWLWLEDITWNERENFTVKFSKRRFLRFVFWGHWKILCCKLEWRQIADFFSMIDPNELRHPFEHPTIKKQHRKSSNKKFNSKCSSKNNKSYSFYSP